MKIDIYAHIVPQKFIEAVEKLTHAGNVIRKYVAHSPTVNDWEHRFRIMDEYDAYVQVLTVSGTHSIMFGDKAVELAKIVNDEVAELISKYPERFIAGVATLPMNDMDAALIEVDRAVNELNLRGVQIWTSINAKPLDSAEFMPLYEKMSQYDLPIWIHPIRGARVSDYSSEEESRYRIFSIFGWPYETTVAMTRLVFSRVLQKYQNLRFITHHCGGMIPYFAHRIVSHYDYNELRLKETHTRGLMKPPIEYFRMFYNDTALNGGTSSLMCAYDFFGAEHLLFGTDMPFDSQLGNASIGNTIHAIEQMTIPNPEKKKIFEDNARKLLHL
jgi:predicted TIM-barrel fold metal-dependent hydrolase